MSGLWNFKPRYRGGRTSSRFTHSSSKNLCKDAETQVEQGSARLSESGNDNVVTEIDMPLEFQTFLKHFFIAKADSDSPIYEKA